MGLGFGVWADLGVETVRLSNSKRGLGPPFDAFKRLEGCKKGFPKHPNKGTPPPPGLVLILF